MLKRWHKIALSCAAIAAIGFAASFLFPANHAVCRPDDYDHIKDCADHYLGPAVVLITITWLDIHGGLVTAIATAFIAWFTWILYRSSEANVVIARRSNWHFRVTERAYVKISPIESGLRWDDKDSGGFTVTFRVKNFGNTPARVTDVVSNAIAPPKDMVFGDIPHNVRHAFAKETKAFLVRDDEFYQHPHNAIDDAERLEVDAGRQLLIVYGYVDYIDQFDVRHRGGFGRQYLPDAKTLNLIFPDTGPWNYDRMRERGEGIDWD